MTPYAIRSGNLSLEVLKDWKRATNFFELLPEPEPADKICDTTRDHYGCRVAVWSCHGIARAFSQICPDWNVADGFFARRGNQHSWLWRHVDNSVVILDIYPVAGIFPILVDASSMSPWRDIYIESRISYSERQRRQWALEAEYAIALLKSTSFYNYPPQKLEK